MKTTMRVLAQSLATRINLDNAKKLLYNQFDYLEQRANTLLCFSDHADDRELVCVIFDSGTVVTWQLLKSEAAELNALLKPACNEPHQLIDQDQFVAMLDQTFNLKPQGYFNVDIIALDSMDADTQLAISYALAQSVKLQYFERKINEFTAEYAHLIEQLAHKGKVKRSSKQISKIIGKLFMIKSSVNLTGAYLQIPKYIWDHVSLEPYYLQTSQYMAISERVSSINQKMDVLNEMFDMLNAQLHHQHGSFLEVVIIVLLVAEIVLGVMPFIHT